MRTFELLERERKTLKQLALSSSTRNGASNSGGGGGGGGSGTYGLTWLVCSAHDDTWLRLVMPASLGGDLSSLLDAHEKALPPESVQFYAGSLVLALQRLHAAGIVFRDLKPENVLLTAEGWPVLSDFGLVAFTTPTGSEDDEFAYSMVGTPEFMAPEVVSGSGHNSDADWWSFGVTLCELLTLQTPFREASDQQHAQQRTYANILQGRYAEPFVKEHYRRLERRTASLLDGLMQVDPAMRLGGRRRGVESLRVHPFFWGLSWEALERREIPPPQRDLCAKQAKERGWVESDSKDNGTPVDSPAVPRRGPPAPAPALDAAAKALDKMFDFSEWGEER